MNSTQSSRAGVLIVDDSVFARRFLIKCLQGAGLGRAMMLEAEHGEAALEQLDRHAVDLIVTDLVMPVMDGWELVRRIRAQERYRGVRIVVVSSVASGSTRDQLLEAGADDVVGKPIDGPKALHILQSAVRESA